jgi:putative ABC transport system permease protein
VFVRLRPVLGDYAGVFRIPLRTGRVLNAGDRDSGAALVNESFARRYFPGTNALGRRMYAAGWREVVGVVADAREQSPTQPPPPTLYWSVLPQYQVTLSVRSRASMASLEAALQRMLERLDPNMPARIATLSGILARGRAPTRFYAVVLGTFAAFALLLTATGVFTLSYYMVNERIREFGVRLALGARPFIIGWSVVSRMLWIALPALAVGSAAGIAASLGLRSVLYGLTVIDPTTLGTSAGVLLTLALLASIGPARRAARLDPAITLRQE